MDKFLIVIASYLVVGALFSIFIKWGNENVIKEEERINLSNKQHHILAIAWPMFVIVFVVAFVTGYIKRKY
jgi:hypothetical protein|tara:strand:- start:260 stop:472 length:213 start_codon:yes stop_codon:yes gene_type:complete